LKGHPEQALVHNNVSSSELWHRRLANLNYRALPILNKMVTVLSDIQVEHDGVCKGCALGNNAKGSFSSSNNDVTIDLRGSRTSYIHMYVDK
jgi:hypothetical protein